MRFAETNLFGVYVAPISTMMIGAWLVTIALRQLANRFGLLRYAWHPALCLNGERLWARDHRGEP